MPVSLLPLVESPRHKRMMLYKRLSVLAGFGALLIVIGANALILRRQLDKQNREQARLARSRQVLLELELTESLLKDAERGQRGYLYTGDPQYLEPYTTAITEIGGEFGRLSGLATEDSRQHADVGELLGLTRTKLSELARTLALYQEGDADGAKTLVRSDVGLETMRRIRDVVSRLGAEETAMESARAGAYARTVEQTSRAIVSVSFLAAALLTLLAYYILREMHQREHYYRELRRREEWYRVTLTSIGDAVIATNPSGQVTFLNPVAETLTGTKLDEDKGKDVLDIFPIFNEITQQPAENPVAKVIELGRVVGLANHTVLKTPDGTTIPIEDSAAPIRDDQGRLLGVVLVFRDVTSERRSQEVLRKTERLASAARLSATVAHEINNPLEAVVNLVFIAKNMPGLPPETIQYLNAAEQELERVAHIAHQTLGFYRQTNTPEQIDLKPLIESVLKLFSNKLTTKNITVRCNYGNCPAVTGVAGELKQVFSNLLANATDAVGVNGTITLNLETRRVGDSSAVELVVEDDGPGIPANVRDRIFEPFFTTKKDVGTGLGLWLTREILERHGGKIELNARDHGASGAAFHILLPSSPPAIVAEVAGRPAYQA